MAEYFARKGYHVIEKRMKTLFAEVDLVLQNPAGDVLLVEVKSSSSQDFLGFRLSPKQRRRLTKTLELFAGKYKNVRLEFAAVNQAGEILLLPEVFIS